MNALTRLMITCMAGLLGSTFSCTTIGHTKAVALFQEADSIYQREGPTRALELYERIIKDYPDDPLYPKALFNTGVIFLGNDNYERAQSVFETILQGNVNDLDGGGMGEGLLAEPYALYKHHACINLANIALHDECYDDALKYVILADSVHRYRHFCGVELRWSRIYIATLYARCYEGLGDIDRAISQLLEYALPYSWRPDTVLTAQIHHLLLLEYTSSELQQFLQEAERTIVIKRKAKWDLDVSGSIELFGQRMDIKCWPEDGSAPEGPPKDASDDEWIEFYRNWYRASDLYQRIMKH